MKKIKGLSFIALTGLAVLSLSLSSCNKSANVKDIYSINNDNKPTKVGECEIIFKENSEIPYISLDEGITIMSRIRENALGDKKYKYELNKVGNDYVISNELGTKCTVNKEKQSLTFDDYDKFNTIKSDAQQPLSMIPIKSRTKALKVVSNEYKAGKELEISLKNYSKLDIYETNNKYYLPLSVYNSVLLNGGNSVNLAYNGTNLFLLVDNQLVDNSGFIPEETELGKKFREGAAKTQISQEYLDYYYQSLCFDFDIEYGLKNKFESFDKFVTDYNFKTELLSTNPKQIDNYTAIILTWLDDGHTGLTGFSNLYDFGDGEVDQNQTNPNRKDHEAADERFGKAKKQKNIKEGIEYSGDTAIVTFEAFNTINEDLLYISKELQDAGQEDIPGLDLKELDEFANNNTAKLFNQLYTDLTSDKYKNTIKNVVIDLTTNNGGAADALVYSLSTLIGNVTIDIDDPLTGAHNKQVYKADMNADGKIDDNDKALIDLGFNIYFLDSSYSFSSANAMPYLAKLNNPNVYTLGAKTAGGPCSAKTYITPIGSMISSSSLNVITKNVDGKYVPIDGIAADYELTEDQMIDRNYILANINNWKRK